MNNDNGDMIVVGSRPYGAVIAWCAKQRELRGLILEQRSFIGGNVRNEDVEGIYVYVYGSHKFIKIRRIYGILLTVLLSLSNFHYCLPVRNSGWLYNFLFNMNIFYQVLGYKYSMRQEYFSRKSKNRSIVNILKPWEINIVSLVGHRLYYPYVKGYIEKEWRCLVTEITRIIIDSLSLICPYGNKGVLIREFFNLKLYFV